MIALSKHAQLRAQQRGISRGTIEIIFEHADIDTYIGSGCRLFRVSRRQAERLAGPDKLSRLALIWSDESAQVVTVMPVHETAYGRRYRAVR